MNGCMNGCPLIGLRRSPTAVSAQARLKRSDGACAHVCVFGAVAVEWRHVGLGCEGAHRGKWVSTGLERALVGKHAGCSRWHEGQGSWHSPLGVKEGRGDARNRGRPVHRDARRRGRRAGTGGVRWGEWRGNEWDLAIRLYHLKLQAGEPGAANRVICLVSVTRLCLAGAVCV